MKRLGTHELEREQHSMIIRAEYKKPAIHCLVSIALAVVLALGVIPVQAAEAQTKDAPTITVIPFTQGTSKADKDLTWVSYALAESITAVLYNLTPLNTVYLHEWRQKYRGGLHEISNRDLFKLGEKMGFDYIVAGEFTRSESGALDIVTRVMEIKKKEISTRSEHTIQITEMPSFARSIAQEIISSLGITALERPAPSKSIKEKAIRENAIGYMKMLQSTVTKTAGRGSRKHFKRAISASPDYTQAWINLGWAYYSEGNYKKALKTFTRANELDSQMVDPVAGMGMAHIQTEDMEQGLDYLRQARSMRPNIAWISEAYRNHATKPLSPAGFPHMMNLLASDDELDRKEAKSALDKFNRRAHLKLFFPFINSPSIIARDYSIRKALKLCDTRCIPIMSKHIDAIKPYANSEETSIRFATVIALGEVGTQAEADVLWNRYHIDPDEKVRLRALASLSFIGDKKAMDVLASKLRSLEDGALKNSIMKSLSRKKDRLSETILLEHIQKYEARASGI